MQLLPNAKAQFIDSGGQPLANGTVGFYFPGTLNPKATFQDSAGTIANTNPVQLDSRGQALIWGSGVYRQILKDASGVTIWDQITEDPNAGLTGNLTDAVFIAGTDFTPGTTTQLTLPVGPGSITNTWIFFDAAYQDDAQASLNGTTLTFASPIPVGVGKVTVKIGTTIAIGTPTAGSVTDTTVAAGANIDSSKLSFLQAGAGASRRTVQDKLRESMSVKDFGAKGDGVTDDTAAITAADGAARLIGAQLYFPAGTYLVSQLVIYTGSDWYGDGRNATTILQKTGSNKDLIYGNNSNANWGSSNPTNIVNGFALRELTLNGNYNAGAGNSLGSGIAAYCARPIIEDVFITNCAEHGIRTEYTDGPAGGDDTFTMEGWISDVRIDTVGKHGWWNNGPHDTVAINVVVVDAGQSANNSFDGFYYDARSTGRNIAMHAWSRQASNRMRYAVNVQSGAQHEFTGGCNFEGAYSAIVALFSTRCIFDDSTRYYAAWNGVNIYLGGNCAWNKIHGLIDSPGAGRPASTGLIMGSTSGDSIASNDIDLTSLFQEAGNILFTSFDSGGNKIRMNCFNQSAGATYGGTPSTNDDVEIMFQNVGVGISHLNNRRQRKLLSLPASGSVTWTFDIPFTIAPVVVYSMEGPSGSAANGTWITSRSATSVTIFNNTTASMTLDAVAFASD